VCIITEDLYSGYVTRVKLVKRKFNVCVLLPEHRILLALLICIFVKSNRMKLVWFVSCLE
jgi:hypothetical protein